MPRGPFVDLTGQRFGRLTVIERAADLYERGGACWTCVCACGRKRVTLGTSLRKGLTTSCGCYATEQRAERMRLRAAHANAMKAFGRRRKIAAAGQREGASDASPHARKPAPTWNGCADAIADLAACLGMR